jgi:tight adherence protein C
MLADRIASIALALGALGLTMLALHMLVRRLAARRGMRLLDDALARRAMPSVAGRDPEPPRGAPVSSRLRAEPSNATNATNATNAAYAVHSPNSQSAPFAAARDGRTKAGSPARHEAERRGKVWLRRIGSAGMRWLDTPLGKLIVAGEDRSLLEQCGFADANARGIFLISRLASAALGLALYTWLVSPYIDGSTQPAYLGAAVVAGFMLPKAVLGRRAAARRASVADETPAFVDLLRLLQGVGLSLDQSLQVIINDFRTMLPVLSDELEIAQRQFVAGRTREQSLQRLAGAFGNEDLRAVARLMIQVDRHGGAVQEPLRQFGERLRETRRARLRERIGRLTVKMTGVMILTLLPALLIVTAGPGIVAITHALSTTHR